MYLRAATLSEALAALAEPDRRILAGGTDVFPAQGEQPISETFVDIARLPELRRIDVGVSAIRIGGAITWTELIRHPLPQSCDGLKAAAHEVGSVQIQNTGTIAGNLCNASPAADGVLALLALDAEVELASLSSGVRRLPLSSFITGYRRTSLAAGEIVTAIIVPRTIEGPSCFVKLGARRYLVISIAMVAAILERGADNSIARARIAIGACSAVAQRQPGVETLLTGAPWGTGAGDLVEGKHLTGLSPIDDVRATGAYRREAALTLIRRAIAQLTAET
jgi:CO/xanthine dehydrogenase FAD-binding subunit